jgi:phospholipid/cholesterol/gamma-HCH transport system substrate-binding protein
MTRAREVMVGAVIVTGVVLAVGGSLWLRDASFGRGTREIQALFSEVGQLMDGSSVKLRGVNIGRVESIAVEPNGEAVRVTMAIRQEVGLPADPAVLLAMESLFGDWQAEIVPKALYSQFPFYEDFEEAGVLAGYSLPDMTRLTAAAYQISANLGVLTDRVEEAFTEETAQDIAQAINNIQDVSERLRELVEVQAGAFSGLASDFQESTVELGTAAHQAHLAFEKIDEILGAPTTDSLLLDARTTVANLKALSDELGPTVRDAQGLILNADSTFSRLNRLGSRIEAGEGALGRLMNDTILVYRAQDVLIQLSVLLEDLRMNPQRYVRISIF